MVRRFAQVVWVAGVRATHLGSPRYHAFFPDQRGGGCDDLGRSVGEHRPQGRPWTVRYAVGAEAINERNRVAALNKKNADINPQVRKRAVSAKVRHSHICSPALGLLILNPPPMSRSS